MEKCDLTDESRGKSCALFDRRKKIASFPSLSRVNLTARAFKFESKSMTWFFFPNAQLFFFFSLSSARNDVQTCDLSRCSLTTVFSFNPRRDISSVQFVRFERDLFVNVSR